MEQNPMDYNIFISGKPEPAVSDLTPLYLEMHIVVDKILYDFLGSDGMIVTNKVIEIIGLVNSYSKKITLEAFSVIVTQMLGLSLGISYDDPKKCQCPGVVCIMNPEAMQFSGVKMFSSCSLRDFENFLSNMGAKCLQNKPQMQSAKQYTCGNGKVEGQETCDCGTIQQCAGNVCCDPLTCQLRPGAQCDKGRCCKKDCKFQSPGYECRHRVHPECDISEFCNGTSAQCEPDITIHNGRLCKKGKFMCYDGDCQDLDARCESIFGKGSKNAPFFCYEEVHSQSDRFGNCGFADNKYVMCMWRNLMCGRLVCTYPTRTPFQKENTSVIYAYLRDTVCITADYRVSNPQKDPMIIRSGSVCDTGRVCVSTQCVEARWIEYQERDCTKKCSGNGVCNSKKQCHCFAGYKPPNCAIYGRTSSELPGKHGLIMERTLGNSPWILIVYTALPVLTIGIIIAVSWNSLKKRFTKEEESISSETESSTHTYASSSRSESSDQTDITRTRSEVSTQMDISRSKSQYSTQTPESSN